MDLMTKIFSAHSLHEKHTDISRIALVPEDLHHPFLKSTLPGSNAGGKWASLSLFHFVLRLFLLDKWWMKSFIVSACISMAAICLRAPFVWRHGRKQLYWFDSELNLPQVSLQTMPNLWVKWQTGWQKRKKTLLNLCQDVNIFAEDIPRSQGTHILAGFDWFDGVLAAVPERLFLTYETFKRIYSVLHWEPSGMKWMSRTCCCALNCVILLQFKVKLLRSALPYCAPIFI